MWQQETAGHLEDGSSFCQVLLVTDATLPPAQRLGNRGVQRRIGAPLPFTLSLLLSLPDAIAYHRQHQLQKTVLKQQNPSQQESASVVADDKLSEVECVCMMHFQACSVLP